MVDIQKRELTLEHKTYRIKSFETWWAVEGLGLFSTLDEIKAHVPAQNFNLLTIRPVPVAVTDQPGVYEAL